MNQPTHVINLTLAVDFTKIFAPERIEGVKFMLGVETDEEVLNTVANEIVSEAEMAIKKRKDYVAIADAVLAPYGEQQRPEVTHQHYNAVEDVVEHDYESMVGDEGLEVEDMPNPEDPEVYEESDSLLYDTYSNKLIENISNDIFNIESHLGTDIKVYLKEYSVYSKTIENELEDVATFVPISEIGEQAEELQAEDYVIEYKDIQGETKYGKRNLNKKEELEGESE